MLSPGQSRSRTPMEGGPVRPETQRSTCQPWRGWGEIEPQRWTLGFLLPSPRAPTLSCAHLLPGWRGFCASKLQRSLGRLLPERLPSTLAALSVWGNPDGDPEDWGAEGSRARSLFLPRRARASGRQVLGAPRGDWRREPRAGTLCSQAQCPGA